MFVVQSSGITDMETVKVMDACLKAGLPYTDVGLIPFTDKIVNIERVDPKAKNFFYGSTKLVKLVKNSEFSSGVFFDNDNFNVTKWVYNRKDMLNYDSEIMTVREFLKGDGTVFVRPLYDLKDFDGVVVEDRAEWFDLASYQRTNFDESLTVSVSKPKEILEEYRVFIVNGRAVSASLYKENGRLKLRKVDSDALHLINKYFVIDKWLPNKNVVMDLAATPKGNFVTEFNCINASGFYANDVDKIVESVYNYLYDETAKTDT